MQGNAATTPEISNRRLAVFFDIPCQTRLSACRSLLNQEGSTATLLEGLEQSNENNTTLILFMAPFEALACALDNGQEISVALDAWMQRTEAVMAFFRQNRGRTRLVQDTAFLKAPEKWIGREVKVTSDRTDAETLSVSGSVSLLLGSEALRRNISATKLAEELEASAAFTEHDTPDLDLELVRQEQTDTAGRLQALTSELTHLKEEQEAVLRELTRVQEKAASALDATLTADRLENQLHQMRQGLESTEAQLAVAQTALTEKKRELGRLNARLKKREEDLAKVYASKSYRVTRPLRLLRAAFFQRTKG